MDLATRVAGIFANYLGEKDEHAVITEFLYPPLERFAPPSGVDPSFVKVWSKMDLSHVFGFPLWEKEVRHVGDEGRHVREPSLSDPTDRS